MVERKPWQSYTILALGAAGLFIGGGLDVKCQRWQDRQIQAITADVKGLFASSPARRNDSTELSTLWAELDAAQAECDRQMAAGAWAHCPEWQLALEDAIEDAMENEVSE